MTRATMPISTSSLRERQQLVYVRQVTAAAAYIDGQDDGWQLRSDLRCDVVSYVAGPRVGYARFSYVPPTSAAQAVESVLAQFGSDDQVKVVLLPYEDELAGASIDDANAGETIFIGRLGVRRIELQRQGDSGEREIVSFEAQPLAAFDNDITQHQVFGRWVIGASDGGVDIIEAFTVPAAFNVGGAANLSATTVLGGDGTVRVPCFTHDHDPAGLRWRVGDAIMGLLGQWLYGTNGYDYQPAPKARNIAIEAETLAALQSPQTAAQQARWSGLADEMPELSVHGLGVLDALQAICDVVGYQFSCLPNFDGLADRPYVLRLWKRKAGRIINVALAKRGSSYSDPEIALRANNVSQVIVSRDASDIVNEIYAHGLIDVEARLDLKPLWDYADIQEQAGLTPTAAWQGDPTAVQSTDAAYTYLQRHVAGGVEFDRYQHVGRAWGIHCTGGEPRYPASAGPSAYQVTAGFDWVAQLGLQVLYSALGSGERTQQGISRPIVWTRRIRPLRPLRHPDARRAGVDYVLEVSEDAGVNWHYCPLQLHVLTQACGVQLHVNNLASVNLAALYGGPTPAIADSWWQLLLDGDLRFRVTAAVEADHGWRHNAVRRASSGSVHYLGQIMLHDEQRQIIRSAVHYFAAQDAVGAQWAYIDPATNTVSDQPINAALRTLAERRQAALEDADLTGTLNSFIVDAASYRVGDQIGAIDGRNISLATNAGAERRYPNIQGITLQLTPGGQQLQLALDETREGAA